MPKNRCCCDENGNKLCEYYSNGWVDTADGGEYDPYCKCGLEWHIHDKGGCRYSDDTLLKLSKLYSLEESFQWDGPYKEWYNYDHFKEVNAPQKQIDEAKKKWEEAWERIHKERARLREEFKNEHDKQGKIRRIFESSIKKHAESHEW